MATQVVTNGYFTFDGYYGHYPHALYNTGFTRTVVAPLFTYINERAGVGKIHYEVHTNATSEVILSQVNELINNCSENNFTGEWLLVTSWEEVIVGNPNDVS